MGIRQERLGDQVRDILAQQFSGGRISDPSLQGVTITFVKMSSDLQLATVYFRLYDPSQTAEALQGLERCKGFLRKNLAGELDLRRVPDLRYFYDDRLEKWHKIDNLLRQGE